MNTKNILPLLPNNRVFNKMIFRDTVHSIYPGCTEASINWMLVTLRKQGRLVSAGTGKTYTREYVNTLREKYKKDPSLLERVLFAFGLLEAIL